MSINKKHVFYIEGADNVGKSTVIESFKNTDIIDNCKYHRISFSKYPNYSASNDINTFMKQIKELEQKKEDNTITRWQYINQKKELLSTIINFMLDDMSYSFTNDDDNKYYINYPDDICNICDRGILSTYLYQYKNLPGIPKFILGDEAEVTYLKDFIDRFVKPRNSENPMSIIILHNNVNPLVSDIIIDETETIEYKKQYDHDVELQTRINSSLNNIVGAIDNKTINKINNIKFYYINIFDETGSTRKTPNAICQEILSIINKEE